ncbi:MAG: RNA-guided endonuclease TnpB family protein [Candidatus Thiodiazotropha sp.]
MIRAYKQRLYPSAGQTRLLAGYFGSARFVWNVGLEMISRAYSARGERLNYVDVSRQLTLFKRTPEFAWLADTPADVYAQKLRDLDKAFAGFFAKRGKYPRFKKRGHAESVRFVFDHRHAGKVKAWLKDGEMTLPKLGKVKLRDASNLPAAMPKMVTVSKDPAGRYFASFAVEEEIDAKPIHGRAIGIDMGVASLATLSDGSKIENPRFLDKLDAQLRFQQRKLSRKVKGSNRWYQQRQRVARIHARIRDSRRDYLQKKTTEIIESQDVIAVESLHVKGMVKNRRLARTIHDTSMSEFISMLSYKADWYGKTLVEIDQWFPSSKTCSCCGHRMDEMNLAVREWTCPKCQKRHDRDVNAARTVLGEGLRILGGTEESTRVERKALASRLRLAGETGLDEARIGQEA